MFEDDRKRPSTSTQGYLPGMEPVEAVEPPNWRALAYAAFVSFINANPRRKFLLEDFRRSLPDGFPQPKEPRRWSVIAMDAARDGLIVRVGTRLSKSNGNSHARPMTLWRVKRWRRGA